MLSNTTPVATACHNRGTTAFNSVAAYAHSPDNVTVLAIISANNGSHAAYFENMMLLRLANDHRVAGVAKFGSGPRPVPTGKEILMIAKKTLGRFLPNTLPTVPFFGGLKDDEPVSELDGESTSWIRIRSLLNQARDITDNALIYALDKGMNFTGIVTAHELLRRKAKTLTDRAIEESFHPVIQELLDSALKNHNVTIDFAVLSLPEYFPPDYEYIPIRACISLGISSSYSSTPKPLAALESVATKPDARILILDHGRHHMVVQAIQRDGVRKRNDIRSFSLPFDGFRGEALEVKLFQRVISKGIWKDQLLLKKKFNIDLEGWKLHNEIERARILIKDNVFDCIGKDRMDGEDCEEDRHHDEWPLNLNNWWSIIDNWGPSSVPSVVLAWEDVQAVEDHYVEKLSGNLDTILRAARMTRDGDDVSSDPGPQQEIDAVVIVTDQFHGSLLRRAAKLTVGDGVRIYGGRLTDFTMAAEGAAILALNQKWHGYDFQEEYDNYWQDYEDDFQVYEDGLEEYEDDLQECEDGLQECEDSLTLVPPVCEKQHCPIGRLRTRPPSTN
ncbi:hypothetical protein V500_02125 [Pseudogymnoascus sp. VKM F-4518 (FW-2643)]|nr:hypothetical protein V500_02125 [Pseudogymnoascus sp. VKM F-4518 (FW-2643)]